MQGREPEDWTVTRDSVVVVLDGVAHTVKVGDKNFEAARTAALASNWDELATLLSPGIAIQNWSRGAFRLHRGQIYYRDDVVPTRLHKRMLAMLEQGDEPSSLMKFWERLQMNPSFRSVNQLFDFLDNAGIPIDSEGYILAYKNIRKDYRDWYTGQVEYRIGSSHRMPRNKVSDESKNPCDHGFHVGSLQYLHDFHWGDSLHIVCRVDPADVVRVPESERTKMGVCALEVTGFLAESVTLPNTVLDEQKEYSMPSEANNDDEYDEVAEQSEDLDAKTIDDETVATTQPDLEAVSEPEMVSVSGAADLASLSLDDLRKRAKAAGIRNTHGVPGGKLGLIHAILAVQDTLGATEEAPPTDDFASIDALQTAEDLCTVAILPLRRYARFHLNVVGASKIPGGKEALAAEILRVRKLRVAADAAAVALKQKEEQERAEAAEAQDVSSE